MALEDLLERIDPNKYINALSKREDLTWDIIQKYSSLSWSARALSRLAPLEYIEQHSDKPWDYPEISKRNDLNMGFMKYHKNKLYWWSISRTINFQDVIGNMDLSWDNKGISSNKNVKLDDIIENPQYKWCYGNLSEHIDLDFIYANPQCDWDYYILSNRVDLWFIRDNLTLPWHFSMLSRNPNLTIDFILEHLDKNWDWSAMISNPNITLVDLISNNLHYKDIYTFQLKYPDYCIEHLQDLDWKIISEYASLDSIQKYPALPWKYNYMSLNQNITIDFVLENKEIPWNYSKLSRNPGITLEDVLNNWNLPWNILNIIKYL